MNRASGEQPYQTPQFQEKEFARWMEKWVEALEADPAWQELIDYRGISALDASYVPIYFRFLESLRSVALKEPREDDGSLANERTVNWHTRARRVVRCLRDKDLTVGQGVCIASERLAYRLRMSLPAKRLHVTDKRPRALVVRAYPNSTPLPVVESLAKDLKWEVLFSSWNRKLENPVRQLGLPYVHLEDLYRKQYLIWRNHHRRNIKALFQDLDAKTAASKFSEIAGIDFQYDPQNFFIQYFSQVRTYSDLYFDLLTSTDPDVVVLFNESSPPDRTMARVAKLANVPSVTLQHGLFIGHVYRDLATDKMIVWGSIPREFWLRRGCSPDQVVSVGAFGHEHWSNQTIKDVGRSNQSRPTVLVLGQNPAAFLSRSMHRDTIAAVMQAAGELKDLEFIIKPHPGERSEPYVTALQSQRLENVRIQNGADIQNLISRCDLVITVFSTAGLEAMLLGKPVLVLNLSTEPPLAPYVLAAVLVTEAQSLAGAVSRILEDEAFRQGLTSAGRQFAQEYLGPLDGRAALRGAEAVAALVNAQT